jgi:ubiquinol-cytochrome c reductase cytochrome b subunit
VPKRMNKLGSAGAPGSGSFLTADPIAEHEALAEAAHNAERKALTALRTYQDDGPRRNGAPRNGRSSDTADDGVGGSRAKSH